MTEDLRAIVSGDGWLRYSNSQGNCIEVCRDEDTGWVRIRESGLPRKIIEVHPRAWELWLGYLRVGLRPELLPDGGMVIVLIVDVQAGRCHQLTTTAASVASFCAGAQAGAFDELPTGPPDYDQAEDPAEGTVG